MIKKITWKNVLEKIENNAPQAYNALSVLEIKESELLYLLKYPYGSNIINQKGEFLLPNGIPLSKNHAKELNEIKPQKILSTALLLKGQCEKYIEFDSNFSKEQQLYSIGLHRAGEIISILATHHHQTLLPISAHTPYQLSSGLRTSFILPGIKDKVFFNKLCQRYHFCSNLFPSNFSKQWHLFKALINQTEFNNLWHTELIIFPKSFSAVLNSTTLQEKEYGQIDTRIQTSIENKIWDALTKKFSKDDYDLVNSAKNILLSGISRKTLYHFAQDDESGPYSALSKIFYDIYPWEHYDALFMNPTYLKWTRDNIGYYSINNIYQERKNYRLLSKAIRVKNIIDSIFKVTKDHKKFIAQSTLKGLEKLELNFYHAKNTSNSQFNNFSAITLPPSKTKKIYYRNGFLYCCVEIIQHNR